MLEYHTELFFLGNHLLGENKELHFHTNEERSAILFHRLYFCPVCGEVWLRRVWSPVASYTRGSPEWQAVPRACSVHGDGTILRPTEPLDHISPEILRREILLLKCV